MDDRALWRGKRIDNGEWVQGSYVPVSFWGNNVIIEQPPIGAERFTVARYPIQIDPSTLGQCTGLKDKYGTRIFEGDIIRACETRGGFKPKKTVIWDESNRKFAVKWEEYDGDCFSAFNSAFKSENIKIIGNIHDGEFAKGACAEWLADTRQQN